MPERNKRLALVGQDMRLWTKTSSTTDSWSGLHFFKWLWTLVFGPVKYKLTKGCRLFFLATFICCKVAGYFWYASHSFYSFELCEPLPAQKNMWQTLQFASRKRRLGRSATGNICDDEKWTTYHSSVYACFARPWGTFVMEEEVVLRFSITVSAYMHISITQHRLKQLGSNRTYRMVAEGGSRWPQKWTEQLSCRRCFWQCTCTALHPAPC